jgi:TolB-like protein/tetratricopeptide (TPR) repeat protein
MILTLQKLLQKSKQVTDPRDTHALALDLVESMLRHYAVVAIAAYRHAGAKDPKVNRILSEQLPRPSMGSWKNFLQVLAAAEKDYFPEQFWEKFLHPLTIKVSHPDIAAAYDGLRKLTDQDVFAAPSSSDAVHITPLKFLDAAVSYRNRFAGHGTHELPDSALQNAPLFLKGTALLCTHLSVLWLACPVYVAKQAKLYGRTFFRLIPLVEAEGINELQAAAPGMEEDRLYICFGDKKHPEVESLYPIVLWEEDDILFVNGAQDLKEVRYIGYVNQKSFETVIYEEDFRAFLEPISMRKPEKPETSAPPVLLPPKPVWRAGYRYRLMAGILGFVALLIAGFALYPRFKSPKAPVAEKQEISSIAVLPFRNMSSDKEQEYFCDGVAEEILNALTYVKDLKVIARSSSFEFRGDAVDIGEVGGKLGVESVLEGSVRKSGKTVRITAQLIRVSDKSHIWSNVFERELTVENMFTIQEEISHAIVEVLQIKLTGKEQEAITRRPTNNQDAWDLYWLGKKHIMVVGKKEEYQKALTYFQKAVELDPRFAEAYTGIASSYYFLSDIPNVRKNLEKSLEINENLPSAYVIKAVLLYGGEWNFAEAEKNLQKALELNPGYVEGHVRFAQFLRCMGRYDEAVREIETARELDPLNILTLGQAMAIYMELDRFDIAMEMYQKAEAIDPGNLYTQRHLGRLYYFSGKYEEALKIFEAECNKLGKNTAKDVHIGVIYALWGKREKADEIIKAIQGDTNAADLTNISGKGEPSDISYIYAAMGDNENAFKWLEKAYQNRSVALVMLKIELEFKKIRSDPRFNIMLKKIGLPTD